MMTPEQVQRTIEFILSSQADSAVRMDRLEENLGHVQNNLGLLQNNLGLVQNSLGRVQDNLILVTEEHQRFNASLREQKESVDVLLSVTQDLVRVSKIQNERMKRLESKTKRG